MAMDTMIDALKDIQMTIANRTSAVVASKVDLETLKNITEISSKDRY
jgi:hypothetical protein